MANTQAFSMDATKMENLKSNMVHCIDGMKCIETKYGDTFILLIDGKTYWSNQYMKKCLNGADLTVYEDSTIDYLSNKGSPIATLEIADSNGKYSKSYKFTLLPAV